MYSLYVHPPPWGQDGYFGYSNSSIFYNYVIKDRVRTQASKGPAFPKPLIRY